MIDSEMLKAMDKEIDELFINNGKEVRFIDKLKEYLFGTAEYYGAGKNIEEWYLRQTLKFIDNYEKTYINEDKEDKEPEDILL